MQCPGAVLGAMAVPRSARGAEAARLGRHSTQGIYAHCIPPFYLHLPQREPCPSLVLAFALSRAITEQVQFPKLETELFSVSQCVRYQCFSELPLPSTGTHLAECCCCQVSVQGCSALWAALCGESVEQDALQISSFPWLLRGKIFLELSLICVRNIKDVSVFLIKFSLKRERERDPCFSQHWIISESLQLSFPF